MSPIRCTQNPTMGRGVAQGLAPGAHPPAGVRQARSHRRGGSGRAGGGAGPRQAGLRRDLGREGHGARRAGGPRVPPARPLRLGDGSGTTASSSFTSSRTCRSTSTRAWTRDSVLGFGFPRIVVATGARWAKRRRRTPLEAPGADRGGRPGALSRRRDGWSGVAEGGKAGRRLGRRSLLHGAV